MKKSFEFTPRELEDDIRAQVSRVFHEARWVIAQLILPGSEIKSPTIEQTTTCPLARMMRDVFDHAAGIREVPDVYSTCKQLLRILFGKAPSHEGSCSRRPGRVRLARGRPSVPRARPRSIHELSE